MSGTLTGSIAFTGNYAGKFNSISLPVVTGNINPGTCIIIYNGQTVTGHVYEF
jgi:hypothetical protein